MSMMMGETNYVEAFDDLDNTMDDLFLEPEAALETLSPQLPAAARERLMELCETGCRQKLAWSSFGPIAWVDGAGGSLNVQIFGRDHAGSDFVLSDPEPYLPFHAPILPGDGTIHHICYSHTGLDVLLVYTSGHVYLYTTLLAINRLKLIGNVMGGLGDPLGGPVGVQWLHPQRPTGWYYSATKTGETWAYSSSTAKPPGPVNPHSNKQAVILITRGSVLRLIFAESDNTLRSANTNILGAGLPTIPLNHAVFLPETRDDSLAAGNGSFLLATYDDMRDLRLYRVMISWNLPFTNETAKQNKIPPEYRLNPSSEIQLLFHVNVAGLKIGNPAGPLHLSHLELLPDIEDPIASKTSPPTILAAFVSGNALHGQFQPKTDVVRWEILERYEKLDDVFETFADKPKKPVQDFQTCTVKRLDDYTIQGNVLSIHPCRSNTALAFSLADGSIELRDRSSMERIVSQNTSTQATSLVDSGFQFPQSEPFTHVSFSPNGCAAVVKATDSKDSLPRLVFLELHDDSGPDESVLSASMALAFASSCVQHNSNDDVLAIMHRSKENVDFSSLMKNIHQSIDDDQDLWISDSQDKSLRSPMVLRCLSIQHALLKGSTSYGLASRLAWHLIDTRSVSISLHIGRAAASNHQDVSPAVDLPTSLMGVVRWAFDLLRFLTTDLIDISHACQSKSTDRARVMEHIYQKRSTTLFLLLCNTSRVFLRAICSSLPILINIARFKQHPNPATLTHNQVQPAPTQDVKVSWKMLLDIFRSPLVQPAKFNALLTDIDQFIKTRFEELNYSAAQKTALEVTMLTSAQLPNELMPTIKHVLTDALSSLVETIDDPLALYAHDYAWLGMLDNARKKQWQKMYGGKKWDVLRKVPIILDQPIPKQGQPQTVITQGKLRKCTRCASYMEDIITHVPQWILHLQKSCNCGHTWALVNR